jgi:hypothetical protein
MDDLTRRRKLIQGSLAAPLVLTVGRAGANARTTFAACLTESEHRPEPEHFVEEPDEIFRISRDVYEIRRRDEDGGHKGPGKPDKPDRPDKPDKPDKRGGRGREEREEDSLALDERGPKDRDNQYVLGLDNQTLYRIDGSRLVPQHLDFSHASFGRSSDFDLRPTGKKVDILAYLDDNGEVVGLAPQRSGGQWTTKRCYDSIMSNLGDESPRRHSWWG